MKTLLYIALLFPFLSRAQGYVAKSAGTGLWKGVGIPGYVIRFKLPVAPPAGKDSAKFSVSSAPITTAGYTNVSGDPSTGVRTGTGGNTNTITFSSVAPANWIPSGSPALSAFPQNGYNVVTNFNNGTLFVSFPASVTQENWYTTFPLGGLDTTKPQIRIGGLKPNTSYTIEMASSDRFNTSTWTDYYLLGAGTTVVGPSTVNSGNVTPNTGAIMTVTSDSNGVVRGYIIASGAHTGTLGMVNGVVIVEN